MVYVLPLLDKSTCFHLGFNSFTSKVVNEALVKHVCSVLAAGWESAEAAGDFF